MKTVIVLGDINIDIILSGAKKHPIPGGEILAREHTIKPGGSAANVASMLAANGHPVKLFGLVGNDPHGKFVVEELRKYGLDVGKISFSNKNVTGMTVSLTYSDDRMYITSPGTVSSAKLEDLAEGYILKGAHLHLSSYFLQIGLKPDVGKLLKDAKAIGMTTSLDPGGDPGEEPARFPGCAPGKVQIEPHEEGKYREWDISGLKKYFIYLDWFMPNAYELSAITGEDDTRQALHAFPGDTDVVVKKGADGASARFKGSIMDFPGMDVDVVDTTCAGDCFDAGFLYSICRGGSLSEAVTLGNKYGARAVSCVGLPLLVV